MMLRLCNKSDRLALLMGGDSPEASVSHQGATGVAEVLSALDDVSFTVLDVSNIKQLVESLRRGEFVNAFNLVHGEFGEGGGLTALLEHFSAKHTGASAAVAAVCFDKNLCKHLWRAHGLPTPDWQLLPVDPQASFVCSLPFPMFCKPTRSGSSLGSCIVNNQDELHDARQRHQGYGQLMVEAYVLGREYSTSFVQDTLLPTIELKLNRSFYDYQAKYQSDQTRYLPAPQIDNDAECRRLLESSFRDLSCRQWGRIDYIRDHDGQIQLLEINTVPGMGSHSLLPKSAALAGYSYQQTVAAILANCQSIDQPTVSSVL